MTTIEYRTPDGSIGKVEEVYQIKEERQPLNKLPLWKQIELKEDKIKDNLIQQAYEILSCKSELITKRRYKRRIAKKLMKIGENIEDE